MAIREKTKKSVEAIVNKGGSSIKEHRSNGNGAEIKRISLRLFTDFHERINALRETRRGSRRISLHGWILEAIEEKLERDEKRRNS